jgi:UDP-N-acetylmuramate dehydrogenase
MKLIENFSLQKYNTFGLDIYAKYFIEINSTDDAIKFFKDKTHQNEVLLVLGGGSNVLFSERQFDGIIVKNNIPEIHVVKEDEHFFWVKAGAGVMWHTLVESCINANFGGIENLSLIPGTVGAAPIQNIGAYGVELKDTFEALEAIEISTGEKQYFRKEECQFGYRDSIFKKALKGKFFITNIVLRLLKEPILITSYGNVHERLKKLNKKEYTIKDVSEVIIEIRRSKLPDPEIKGNAGSFFKNPVINNELFSAIRKSFPDIPSFEHGGKLKKIPAAWLIDQIGLKGFEYKGAAVHINQPLVLINNGDATGQDLIELSQIIQQKVNQQFGIHLDPEVTII